MAKYPGFERVAKAAAEAAGALTSIDHSAVPEMPPIGNVVAKNVEANHASEFHSRLIVWINGFDKSLDNEHEVGVRLVSFGQTVVFSLRDINYWNPSLISFSGETDDGLVELIQHVSQISILLMKLPRKNPEEPKKPIGFHVNQTDPKEESSS